MKIGTRLQAIASLTSTASASATLFAAAGSGTKWHLKGGFISVVTPIADAYVQLQETYSAGTAVGVIANIPTATNAVSVINMEFEGEDGYVASATNSRLIWLVAGGNATVNCIFTGYSR